MKEGESIFRYSDIFYQENENEILQIHISNEDRFLMKKEMPMGIVWRGDHESSVFYAYLADLNEEIIQRDELAWMNEKFQNKIQHFESLKLTISPLLNIVQNGWYQVFYYYGKPYNFEMSYDFKSDRSSVWVDNTILPTQNWHALDQERIDFYKNSIALGNRPTIVTMAIANFERLTYSNFQESYTEETRASYVIGEALDCINPQFIIDGHHKAKAYIEMNEKPSIISLVRLQFKNENDNFNNIKNTYLGHIKKQIGLKIE